MKSEPEVYSINDLAKDVTTLWDGIRNYQARNYMRSMQIGDRAFFYHSNTSPPGIAGLMEVIEVGLTDPSQFDPTSKYFDPRSLPKAPRWDCVRLKYLQTWDKIISLEELKQTFSQEELGVVRKGNRLSILPVPEASALKLYSLAGRSDP